MTLLLEMFTYPFIVRAFAAGVLLSLCAALLGVDEDYTALENELAQTVANIESTHPGYDEYRYSVDEIGPCFVRGPPSICISFWLL